MQIREGVIARGPLPLLILTVGHELVHAEQVTDLLFIWNLLERSGWFEEDLGTFFASLVRCFKKKFAWWETCWSSGDRAWPAPSADSDPSRTF